MRGARDLCFPSKKTQARLDLAMLEK